MKFIYTFLVIAMTVSSHAQTIYVRSGGNGTGTSWADAQGNLKIALDQATAGSQIWVAAGTYTPHATDRQISFILNAGVSVLGGFPATGNPTPNDRNPANHPTVLSGDIGMVNNISDNSYTVLSAVNVGTTSRLDGLIIFNGNASENNTHELASTYTGGGLYLVANDGMPHSPTIENCIFSNNAGNTGAAVFVLGTNNTLVAPIFRRCTFTNNTAVFGGAIQNEANNNGSNEAVFEDCIFQNNEATETGGAMTNIADDGNLNINIARSAFYHNTSPVGGAIFNFPNNGTIVSQINNAIFYKNQAESGGAIDNFGFDTDEVNLLLSHCTFTENTADLGGALSTFGGGVTVQSTNSIFWDNLATGEGTTASNFAGGVTNFSYCLIQESSCNENGFVANCDHNLFAIDPLFINPDNFNFLLAPCSPVLNEGTNIDISATDFAGNNRNFGGMVDLGALEWNGTPGVLTVNHTTPIDISCHGETDGRIVLEISGGVAPYNFSQPLENLSAGTYSVDIVDALGCMTSTTATIIEPSEMSSVANIISALSCFSIPDGRANITVMGGVEPYSYLWDNGETTAQASSLSAGTHTVIATDINGCTTMGSVNLTAPSPLVALASITSQIACGENGNGVATVDVSGGTPTYTLLWDNGSTDVNANNLSVGEHCVTVTDANNCTTTSCITLQGSNELTITPTVTQSLLCNGDTNGAASVTVVGGIPPYTYAWENGSMAAETTHLGAGNHTVTITDSNECTSAITITLNEPAALILNLSIQNMIKCANAADGQILANAVGGVEPYTYHWSNGGTTPTMNNLRAGEYCLTLTDANNCHTMACLTLTEPSEISTEITIVQELLCFGDENGVANIVASGGTPPYHYAWPHESMGTNLSVGTYPVTITDANNCEQITEVTLTQPDELVIIVENITHLSQTGANDGSIEISVVGGTGHFTFAWDHGIGNVQNPTGLSPAIYTLMVTDEHGCSTTAMATVADLTLVNIIDMVTTNVSCHGGQDGSIEFNIVGGVPPYTFTWNNGISGDNLPAGTYSFTVTDAVGTSSTASATITEPDALDMTIVSIESPSCNGENDGAIILNVTGGTPTYTYHWADATIGNIPNPTGLLAGDYELTITDDNGCVLAALVTLLETPELTATMTATSDDGTNNGTATIVVVGGTAPYTYNWVDANMQNTPTITGLAAGTYVVIVMDANGCTLTSTVEVMLVSSAIDSEIMEYLELFPNPTTGDLTIRLALAHQSATQVSAFDALGREILRLPMEKVKTQDYRLDLSDLTSGVYYIKIALEETIISKRIIVE